MGVSQEVVSSEDLTYALRHVSQLYFERFLGGNAVKLSSRTMAHKQSPNRISPQSHMEQYSPPYSRTAYAPPTSPYGHQQLFYPQPISPIQVDDAQYDSSIHPYWKDRVAPRHGFRSPRTLGPPPESSRIVIKDPKKSNETSSKQLLTPRSHTKSNKRKTQTKENQGATETKGKSPEINPTPVSEPT